jgi:hypothetical protein
MIRGFLRRINEPPAITPLMLDLCSAPCKALRFASTALTRGLRALTVPARSSSTGNYVMAGRVTSEKSTDRD